jgi:hypothetical protein
LPLEIFVKVQLHFGAVDVRRSKVEIKMMWRVPAHYKNAKNCLQNHRLQHTSRQRENVNKRSTQTTNFQRQHRAFSQQKQSQSYDVIVIGGGKLSFLTHNLLWSYPKESYPINLFFAKDTQVVKLRMLLLV